MKIADVRRLALALPEATEAPHFDRTSFRVRDKIFATVGSDGRDMNVFVDDEQREIMVKVDPRAYETRMWGKSGYLHVHLAKAKARDVETLLQSAWERKAPKKLVAQLG
ncbi:MAG TPA: MmcQ/YjbR family DNA-binding protein [Gammaproteobacteria bacterium]|nr:MmcQ/YjbR family DNA-binding protein [Gammaproteobacteria bacterium]